jgi:ribosomal protein S18 acetylase RimI-like enzyme
MQVLADDQLMVIDSGLPCDTFNVVCRARLAFDTMDERIRRVVTHFSAGQRPFAWWVGPCDQPDSLGQALQHAGFQAAEANVAMAADLHALAAADLSPSGLQIKRARTLAQIRDFATITAANWQPPDEDVLHFYDSAAPLLLSEDCPIRLYIGYLDGEPVATSEMTVAGGVAGLYNVATLSDYRRRGFGSALTLHPLLEARAEGLNLASLQASPDGQGVYARLGFTAIGQVMEYQLPRP